VETLAIIVRLVVCRRTQFDLSALSMRHASLSARGQQVNGFRKSRSAVRTDADNGSANMSKDVRRSADLLAVPALHARTGGTSKTKQFTT